jgi:peroxiredoxin
MSLLGQSAPDFTLLDTGREAVSLSTHRGSKVVLAFFPGAFTGVCTKEMCAFRDALSNFNDLGATVLGICVDSPFANGVFTTQNDLNFKILSDYDRSTVNAYGIAFDNFAGMDGYVAANRSVFVLNEEGTVTYEWIAPSLGTEPNYDEVKAAVA